MKRMPSGFEALRHAITIVTDNPVAPLMTAEELIPEVYRLGRKLGDLGLAVEKEKEKNRNLQREIAALKEQLREYSEIQPVG
jgi:hypothetical protein